VVPPLDAMALAAGAAAGLAQTGLAQTGLAQAGRRRRALAVAVAAVLAAWAFGYLGTMALRVAASALLLADRWRGCAISPASCRCGWAAPMARCCTRRR